MNFDGKMKALILSSIYLYELNKERFLKEVGNNLHDKHFLLRDQSLFNRK